MKTSANQVQKALIEKGFDCKVKELPVSTRTAQEAAEAIGCKIAQIAKSIILRNINTYQPVLVIASGINHVNIKLIQDKLGEPVEQPNGKWVKETLGFAIGGVPPIGFETPIATLIDEALLQFDIIWAAAGTPNAVFCLPASELTTLTGGDVIKISTSP
jgi:prolyl-tRNA editing enzyme YbaK/EbsC (Cys-tRNA(Pro) deacylase)